MSSFVRPAVKDIITWLKTAVTRHQSLHSKLQRYQDTYEIVFIPGILGSSLNIGDYTFGRDKVDATRLVLNEENRMATPMIMREFSAGDGVIGTVTRTDVYGDSLERLKDLIEGRDIHEFPYDWRQDIALTAERFQKFAEESLKNKRVVIIAHSMGGLVAWHWKNTHLSQGSRPFYLVALVTVGSPLQGSCEIVKTLVQGYSADDEASWFEKKISKLVFNDAHGALFTFPSIFELLPKYGEYEYLVKERDGHHYPQNPFNFGTWHRDSGYSVIRKFSARTGLTEGVYTGLVKKALQTAQDFRARFDPKKHDDRVYLLYSASASMNVRYVMEADNADWLRLKTQEPAHGKNGDGRVLSHSALNQCPATQRDSPRRWPLSEKHDALFKDEKFGEFVKHELQATLDELTAPVGASYAMSHPQTKMELESHRWLISPYIDPDIRDRDPELAKAQQIIAQSNVLRVFPGSVSTTSKQLCELAETEAGRGQEDIASVILESHLVLDASDPAILTRLASLQLRQNEPHKAICVLHRAEKLAVESNNVAALAKIESTLGEALVKTGYIEGAIDGFLRAKCLNTLAVGAQWSQQLVDKTISAEQHLEPLGKILEECLGNNRAFPAPRNVIVSINRPLQRLVDLIGSDKDSAALGTLETIADPLQNPKIRLTVLQSAQANPSIQVLRQAVEDALGGANAADVIADAAKAAGRLELNLGSLVRCTLPAQGRSHPPRFVQGRSLQRLHKTTRLTHKTLSSLSEKALGLHGKFNEYLSNGNWKMDFRY